MAIQPVQQPLGGGLVPRAEDPDPAVRADATPVAREQLLGDGARQGVARAHAALGSLPVRLDGVYSAKAAAALTRVHGPTIFWATKSEVEIPAPPLHALREASPALVRWLLK